MSFEAGAAESLLESRHAALAGVVEHACIAELHAFKPGNVSLHAPGHGLRAEDFVLSARAIARPISAPGLSVGERILVAVKATRAVVATNTNLGIVLLLAPLASAVWQRREHEDFAGALNRVLGALTVRDAELAYEAIRLAEPGGLGVAAQHDVREPPAVTLLEAMRASEQRDTIALQYVSGYRLILDFAVPCYRRAIERWADDEWAIVYCYLALLARVPDSLIARKSGYAVAREVSLQAAALLSRIEQSRAPASLMPQLETWDQELKVRALNPGTSADLVVAALVVTQLLSAKIMREPVVQSA